MIFPPQAFFAAMSVYHISGKIGTPPDTVKLAGGTGFVI